MGREFDGSRWLVIATYALPAGVVAFMENLLGFYLLKFSTDVLLVAPAIMGLLFGFSRVWDALTDPLVGYWSDRTRSRLGRRRPWLLFAALPLGLVYVALWSPAAGLSSSEVAWWMGSAILLYFTVQTTFEIPHRAWGAELSLDSYGRTRVFAGRLVLSLSGVMLAALALGILERSPDPRSAATWLARAAALLFVLAVALAAGRVRERPEYQDRGADSAFAAYRDVWHNRHARQIFGVLFLEALGFASMTVTMPFANEYVFGMPGKTSLMLASALIVMVAGVPLWLALSRRMGKKRVWMISLVMRSAAFGALVIVGPGNWVVLLVGVVVIGAGFGCGQMIAPSVQADVIDVDERTTGQRKEGSYFAAWTLAEKGGLGAAIGLSGLALQAVGFEPNAVQGPLALAGIRALFAGLPCVFYALAAVVLLRLSLYERTSVRGPGEPALAR